MAKKKSKIIKYRKPWNLNVGVIIFTFIFVYLVASVLVYLSKEKVHMYEVVEGSLTSYSDYTALILRSEVVTSCANTGNISYYVREGRRVGVEDLVFSIDESGQMQALLEQNTGESNLPAEDLKELKEDMAQYALSYDPMDYSTVYDMKASLQSTLLKYVNANVVGDLPNQAGVESASLIKGFAASSGVVSMALDGLEGMTAELLTAEAFDASKHPKVVLQNGQMVESGTSVYKLIDSEEWKLVFEITENDREKFSGEKTLTLTFKGTDLEVSGAFETVQGADGAVYGQITLDRYMVQFIDKRYVSIQIETENSIGLKIPISAVVYKNYFQVPKSFLTADGELLVEVYGEDGSRSVEKVEPVTYSTQEEYCYVDASSFQAGQYICQEDSNERYQLTQTQQLPGVYNMNRGYTVFRKIQILDESEEYYIISPADSAVSVYDHIVLNGSTVAENQIIYY